MKTLDIGPMPLLHGPKLHLLWAASVVSQFARWLKFVGCARTSSDLISNKMPQVLVTCANEFVAFHVVDALTSHGHNVTRWDMRDAQKSERRRTGLEHFTRNGRWIDPFLCRRDQTNCMGPRYWKRGIWSYHLFHNTPKKSGFQRDFAELSIRMWVKMITSAK